MLTIEECRKYLEKYDLSDEQVKKLRDTLYCLSENIINANLEKQTAENKRDDDK